MAQKVVSQAYALVRALNQAGDIGQHKTALLVQAYHAQNRGQRRKMVGGNFGAGSAHLCDDAGFAHAGVANQAHVRQQLQLQLQPAVFTRLALFGKGGGAVGAGDVAGIALAATAALGSGILLPILHQVGHHCAGDIVTHQRTHGHLHKNSVCAHAGAVFGAALAATLGNIFSLIAEINQGI